MHIEEHTSTVIKGIAITVIVLGHNNILAPSTDEGSLFAWLYKFHIAIFFILPFFYKHDRVKSLKESITTAIVRNYVPYLWIYVLCFSLAVLLRHETMSVGQFFWGFFFDCPHVTGFVFPWFMPAYCAVTIIKVLTEKHRWLAPCVIVLGLAQLINWNFTWNTLWTNVPFYLMQGIFYTALGLIAKWIFDTFRYKVIVMLCGCFIILSVLYFTSYVTRIWGSQYIFPIIGFATVFCLSSLVHNSRLLHLSGKHSFVIYRVMRKSPWMC